MPTPFPCDRYAIIDSRLSGDGEVLLWSVSALVPTRGELFTIQCDDELCDLAVVEVTGHDPGWTALCRRVKVF